MALRYDEWPPPPELEGTVTALWQVRGEGRGAPSSVILPDGHVELVFNLGAPVVLEVRATSFDQPRRAVVGLLSRAVRLRYRGAVDTFGVRFHPASGAAFLGQPAKVLAEKILPLAQVAPALDRSLARLTRGGSDFADAGARAELTRVLVEHAGEARQRDALMVRVVNGLTADAPLPTVAALARGAGLSPRQLQRRFQAAVGLTPKRYVRVIRFARVWQVATMQPHHGWAELAAAHGYADQAQLVREFRAFGAEPPARLFDAEWYAATGMSRAVGVAKGDRVVGAPTAGRRGANRSTGASSRVRTGARAR